jgi:hypothetical protein
MFSLSFSDLASMNDIGCGGSVLLNQGRVLPLKPVCASLLRADAPDQLC